MKKKAEHKRIANEKRKATWARKKQERDNLRVVEDTSDEDNKHVPQLKLKNQRINLKKCLNKKYTKELINNILN